MRSVVKVMVSALVAVTLLSGCGGGDDTPDPKVSISAKPESEADQAEAVYKRYWEIYIEQAASGDIVRSAYDGVAQGAFLELDLSGLQRQADDGFRRVGAPTFSEYTTTVEQNTATSTVCLDQEPWGVRGPDGELIDTPSVPAGAFTAKLDKSSGKWIMADLIFTEGRSCDAS